MMKELRKRRDLRRIGVDPIAEGRKAITGRDASSVWDFIPFKKARGATFTKFPHLTLSIAREELSVNVTLPSGAKKQFWRNLLEGGPEEFRSLLCKVGDGVARSTRKIPGVQPRLYILQRHYRSQSSQPTIDARLHFDLRTAMDRSGLPVKLQIEWAEAAYGVLENKRSNVQMGIGVAFPYGGDIVKSKKVLDHVAGVWTACEPWLRRILHGV